VVLLFPDGIIGIPRQCQRGIQRLHTWRQRSQTVPAREGSRAARRLDTPSSRTAL
jgi:hypothetical protein